MTKKIVSSGTAMCLMYSAEGYHKNMTSQVCEQSDNSLPNITSSAVEVQVSRIPDGFSVLIHCHTLTLFQKSYMRYRPTKIAFYD